MPARLLKYLSASFPHHPSPLPKLPTAKQNTLKRTHLPPLPLPPSPKSAPISFFANITYISPLPISRIRYLAAAMPDNEKTTPPFLEYVPSYSGRGSRRGKKRERDLGVGFLRAQGGRGRWREDSAWAMLGRRGREKGSGEVEDEGGVQEGEGVDADEVSRGSLSPPLGPGDDLFGEEEEGLAVVGAGGNGEVDCDVDARESDLQKTPIAGGHASAGRLKASPGSWGAGMVRRVDDMRSKKAEPDTPTTSAPRPVAGGVVSTHLRKDPTPSPLRSHRNPASPSALCRNSGADPLPVRKFKKKDVVAPWSGSEGSDEAKTSTEDLLLPETPQSTVRATKRSHAATPRTPVATSTPPRLMIQQASPGPALDNYDRSESLFVTGYTPDLSRRRYDNASSLAWSPNSTSTPTQSVTRNSTAAPSQALRKENHDPATSSRLDANATNPQAQAPLATPRRKGIATKPVPKRARETSPGESGANKKAEPELGLPAAPVLRAAAAVGRKKGIARKVKPGRK